MSFIKISKFVNLENPHIFRKNCGPTFEYLLKNFWAINWTFCPKLIFTDVILLNLHNYLWKIIVFWRTPTNHWKAKRRENSCFLVITSCRYSCHNWHTISLQNNILVYILRLLLILRVQLDEGIRLPRTSQVFKSKWQPLWQICHYQCTYYNRRYDFIMHFNLRVLWLTDI